MNQILNFITKKSIRFWVGLGVSISLVCLVVWLWFTFSLVQISVKNEDNITNSQLEVTASKDYIFETSRALLVGDFAIIPRDSKVLHASLGNYQSSRSINTALFTIPTVDFTFQKDRNADKVAYMNPISDCSVYDYSSDQLLSYNCKTPTQLYSYSALSGNNIWTNKIAAKSATTTKFMTPYRDGAIGIAPVFDTDAPAEDPLFYISVAGGLKHFPAPENIDESTLRFAKIVTDKIHPENRNFLFISWDGAVYYGMPSVEYNSVEYKKMTAPSDYSSVKKSTICTLNNTEAACYTGGSSLTPHSDESSEGSSSNKKVDLPEGKLTMIDFSTENPSQKNTYSIQSDISVDQLFVTKNNTILALDGKRLYKLESQNDTQIKAHLFEQNIDSVDTGVDTYYVKDNTVFAINETNDGAVSRFHSEHINIKRVSVYGESVFALSSVKDGGSRVYAYKINSEVNSTGNKRIIDLLPVTFSESTDISDMDFVGSNIRIRLKVTLNKTVRKNSGALDETALNQAKSRVTDMLEKKGIDLNTVTINFSY
ncbi:hypothetical protein A2791_03585 [Candidatus Saccharibacteria bacterium RIFCSPHIGHO2_01_FULL_46_30]|nr:MAG: hypothetical protein A2791_03585 [Candidatus Saccharibacteria bacterium RIFCSPHIGHO2_01_FULL_46_30]